MQLVAIASAILLSLLLPGLDVGPLVMMQAHDGKLREGGELHPGDLAASLTHMEVKFCGSPYRIRWVHGALMSFKK